jgi:hypothetical protein
MNRKERTERKENVLMFHGDFFLKAILRKQGGLIAISRKRERREKKKERLQTPDRLRRPPPLKRGLSFFAPSREMAFLDSATSRRMTDLLRVLRASA